MKVKGDDRLKKPKAKWQAYASAELEIRGMTYNELANALGETYININQVMCKDNMPNVKKKICEYLGIAED